MFSRSLRVVTEYKFLQYLYIKKKNKHLLKLFMLK